MNIAPSQEVAASWAAYVEESFRTQQKWPADKQGKPRVVRASRASKPVVQRESWVYVNMARSGSRLRVGVWSSIQGNVAKT